MIHIFVTYDDNGLIDSYRIEYGDTPIYDGEVEVSFEDLYERAEWDWKETYRAELPGTVEYQFKREAAALAQESGETWMDEEQQKQFRRVCSRIDRIRSAWDFLCTIQSLEYDFDKRIINAARKFKKCFNFSQYEQPQEVARREELLEDYKKYDFVMEDTTDAEAASAEAGQTATSAGIIETAPVTADTITATDETNLPGGPGACATGPPRNGA